MNSPPRMPLQSVNLAWVERLSRHGHGKRTQRRLEKKRRLAGWIGRLLFPSASPASSGCTPPGHRCSRSQTPSPAPLFNRDRGLSNRIPYAVKIINYPYSVNSPSPACWWRHAGPLPSASGRSSSTARSDGSAFHWPLSYRLPRQADGELWSANSTPGIRISASEDVIASSPGSAASRASRAPRTEQDKAVAGPSCSPPPRPILG